MSWAAWARAPSSTPASGRWPRAIRSLAAGQSSAAQDVQVILEEVRQTIRSVVPEAEEAISYQMPTITLNGKYLVYFAAWTRHIALYAIPTLSDDLEREVAPYRTAKDTVKFPLTKAIPYGLIERIVSFLVARRAGSPA